MDLTGPRATFHPEPVHSDQYNTSVSSAELYRGQNVCSEASNEEANTLVLLAVCPPFLQLMTLYCKTTSYPGFCVTVTCYYSSALERVINVNLSVCNLVPRSSLFVTSVWDGVCFLPRCRWVMRSFACASKASLWTRSLRATSYPAKAKPQRLYPAPPGLEGKCRKWRKAHVRKKISRIGGRVP